MKEAPDYRLYLGIDLGTCNTQISALRGDTLETLPITQNLTTNGRSTHMAKRLPSLICFDEDGKPMFGEIYRKATADMSNYTGRVVYNTKRMLLQRPETKIYHIPKRDDTVDTYSPQDIAMLLLKRCAEEAKRQKDYQAGDKLMITVPCGYQMDQVQATIRAARKAGFEVDEDVELITEPVAALIEYIVAQNDKYPQDDPRRIDLFRPQNVLVYDLGGGTLDLSVVRIEKIGEVFHFTELANNDGERDRTIGGADFDALVAWKMREKLLEDAATARGCTVEQIVQRLEETSYQSKDAMLELLHNRAYEMKYDLHRRPAEVNPITFFSEDIWEMNLDPLYVSLNGGIVNGIPSMSYLDIVRDYLTAGTARNILDPIPSVLDAALLDGCKLPVSQVDKILITGGMCKFQPVRQAVLGFLDKLAARPHDPIRLTVLESEAGLEAVSIGAAYSHKLQIENHNEQLSKRYFLDVTSGLPHELVARGACRTISLLNPTEALFEIYCGTSKADPDMRKQYTYHKRFNPPLSSGAEVTFRLERKNDGEAKLIGTIRQPGKENEDIEFKEETADVEEVTPAFIRPAESDIDKLFRVLSGGANAVSGRPRYTPPAYQGSSRLLRDAPEGTDKRLFINSSSNHDRSVSMVFEKILQLMDLQDELGTYSPYVGMPTATRFRCLSEIIQHYYWSDPDDRRIPVFEYALYAMHQLPLNQLPPPNFPMEGQETAKLYDDDLKELSRCIRKFCGEIGELLLNSELPAQRKEQLEEELNHCITEWRWQDLFQLCISIAQRTASTRLADALKRRLVRRAKAQAQWRPVSMIKPHSTTQQRMTKIYWNVLNKNQELDEADIQNLEILLQGQYCDMDYQWLASESFAKGFAKLPEPVQDRIRRNNSALRQQREQQILTLDEVTLPGQLLLSCFKDACFGKNDPQHDAYWKKVHEFLDNPATCWEMVRVLNRRGRTYDQDTKNRLVTLEPKNNQDRRNWIRALGYCRTKPATAKLESKWRTCQLNRVTQTIYLAPGADRTQMFAEYFKAAQRWLANPDTVTEMTKDDSFELLASLCLCARRDQEKYQYLMSTIIASVPSAWISSQGVYGDYWQAITQAVTSMWQNVRRHEKTEYRKTLTSALFQLTYQAYTKYPSSVPAMDQALFNFSKLFLLDNTLLDLYHCQAGPELLKVFARAALNDDGCPLSASCEKQFLMFLNKRYNAEDMRVLRKQYGTLLVIWYQNTGKLGQAQLLYSDAFRELVGPTPTNMALNLQDIADGYE